MLTVLFVTIVAIVAVDAAVLYGIYRGVRAIFRRVFRRNEIEATREEKRLLKRGADNMLPVGAEEEFSHGAHSGALASLLAEIRTQASSAQRQCLDIKDMLATYKTERNSIMYLRFEQGLDDVLAAVRANVAQAGAIASVFDDTEYERLRASLRRHGKLTEPERILIQGRLDGFERKIEDVRKIRMDNERILLSIERLASELVSQGMSPSDASMDSAVKTVERLVRESKLYA